MSDLRSLLIIFSILAPGKFKLIFMGSIAIWNYWQYEMVRHTGLWGLFLGLGLISSIAAPYPPESFWGHPDLNDGWIFWLVTGMMAMTNRGEPEDKAAIRLGAGINFILWLCGVEVVAHRGHIAALMVLAFAQYPYIGIAAGLITWNRAAVAAVTLVNWKRLGWKICAGAAAVILLFTSQKQMPGDWVDRVSSGRAYQAEVAIGAIQQRPLLGWGWEGYTQSFASVEWPSKYRFKYLGYNWFRAGERMKLHSISTAKVHIWPLDLLLSVGILGTIIYTLLIITNLAQIQHLAKKQEIWAFLIWVITWFDAADYTGIFWLLLSGSQNLGQSQAKGKL